MQVNVPKLTILSRGSLSLLKIITGKKLITKSAMIVNVNLKALF